MNKLKTSWDLSLIVRNPSTSNFEKLRKKVRRESYKFINKWKERTDYLTNPKALEEALEEYNEWARYYGSSGPEGYYFSLLSSLNQADPGIMAKVNKVNEFSKKIENDIQFFELKISKIDSRIQSRLLKNKKLKKYKHFLAKIFSLSEHLLSEPEEKILNLKSTPAHENWTKMIQGFLSKEERKVWVEKGKKETKSFSDLLGLMESQNKKVRDSAANAFNEILTKHAEVSENEINSVLLNKKINDDLRNYDRPDKSRHLADDIESKVVDVVTRTITKRFDISRRYYKLKARLMGLKSLEYHERNVEFGKLDGKYTYDESLKILSKVFSELDEDFGKIFNNFVNERRIDVYPKKGKSSGAFCIYHLITQPVYILLNWTDKLDDVRTFAHEMGHGINDELIKRNQIALNYGTPTSTAEVASTFMEDFVTQALIKKADDELRLKLMVSKLNQDVSSIFRQIAFYNFELDLHKDFREQGYLSKEEIGKLFRKHMISYMGPAVEQSKGSENWWVYVQHFRYFFYVYSYASGLLISKSLQSSVKNDPKFIAKVKEFLSAGLSDSPKNIFMKLGIDITNKKFWEQGMSEVENLLNETEKLAIALNKI